MSPAFDDLGAAPVDGPLSSRLLADVLDLPRKRGRKRGALDLKTCQLHHPALNDLLAEALRQVRPESVRAYADPSPAISLLARHHGLEEEAVTLTAGSDHAIRLLLEAFGPLHEQLFLQAPNYEAWHHYAALMRRPVEPVPHGWRRSDAFVDDLLTAIARTRPSIVAVSNPNGPVGAVLAPDEIREIVAATAAAGHLLVIDECYAVFSGLTHLPLAAAHGHVLVVRSLSKSFALAGARCAMVAGSPDLIAYLERFRPDSTLSGVAVDLVMAVHSAIPAFERIWADIRSARDRLAADLDARRGRYPVAASGGNFVTVNIAEPTRQAAVVQAFEGADIRIRDLSDLPGLEGGVRTAVSGDPDVMAEVRRLFSEAEGRREQ